MTQHRPARDRPARVGALLLGAAVLVGGATGCAPGVRGVPGAQGDDDEVSVSTSVGVPVVDSIDVPGARAALEAGQSEVRRILERELGPDGWTEARPAQENSSSSCGGVPDVGKFYAAEMSHSEALPADRWDRVWSEIVRAVEPHGFAPKEGDAADGAGGGAADGAGHYEYLVNEHRDELTVSSQPGIGTGYGGFSVCHPWER